MSSTSTPNQEKVTLIFDYVNEYFEKAFNPGENEIVCCSRAVASGTKGSYSVDYMYNGIRLCMNLNIRGKYFVLNIESNKINFKDGFQTGIDQFFNVINKKFELINKEKLQEYFPYAEMCPPFTF